jgi:xanthine dehydrogenase YagR molybdenum-binding subunit
VLGAFTHENLPRFVRQPVSMLKVTGMTFEPMQGDVVHYAGQAVAIVVAEMLEQGQGAAELIGVDYEVGVHVATLANAEANNAVFDVERVMQVPPAHYLRGDVDAARAGAAYVVGWASNRFE